MLVAERAHTVPMLRFYLSLLELQTALIRDLATDTLLPAVVSPTDPSVLAFERLPLEPLGHPCLELCRRLSGDAPAPIQEAARAAAGATVARRAELLLTVLTAGDLEELAGALGCAPVPLSFLARALLSPVAERLVAALPTVSADRRSPSCPRCGWPPQVSKLEDEPGAEGSRRLVCSLCATDWVFPRSVCVACQASGDDGIEFHADERLTHVRVEACRTCRVYLKSVDLRVLGLAEPLVDDLATPELDLWAAEQGLEKRVPNLLGL